MKPIALAFKNYEVNPFTSRGSGELMIVHQCLSCNQISPNRIAGDDNEYQVLSILELSMHLDEKKLNEFRYSGIDIITKEKEEEVLISLFGINYKEYILNLVKTEHLP